MVTDGRSWCIICGQPRGNCGHIAGFTNNINEAYRAFLKTMREERDKKVSTAL
jgi:hypothetical protein